MFANSSALLTHLKKQSSKLHIQTFYVLCGGQRSSHGAIFKMSERPHLLNSLNPLSLLVLSSADIMFIVDEKKKIKAIQVWQEDMRDAG